MRCTAKQALILILLLAFALRFYHLDVRAMGTDESWTLRFIEQISAGTFLENVGTHGHPPLFYALLVPFWLLSAKSIYFLRLLMVMLGLLSIYLTYSLAQKLFNDKVALVTALFLAVSPLHILYSQQLRPYIFLMSLLVVSLLLLLSYIKTKQNSYLFWFVVVALASFYSHLFTAFFIVAEFLLLFLAFFFGNLHLRFKPLFVAALITVSGWLLWLPAFLQQYHLLGAVETLATFRPLYIPYTFYKYAVGLDYSSALQIGYWFIVVWAFTLMLLMCYGCYHLLRKSLLRSFFLLGVLFLPVLLMALLGLFAPIYSFRYLSYLTPLFFLMVAYGYANLQNKWIRLGVLVTTVVLWMLILQFYWSVIDDRAWNVHFAL